MNNRVAVVKQDAERTLYIEEKDLATAPCAVAATLRMSEEWMSFSEMLEKYSEEGKRFEKVEFQ